VAGGRLLEVEANLAVCAERRGDAVARVRHAERRPASKRRLATLGKTQLREVDRSAPQPLRTDEHEREAAEAREACGRVATLEFEAPGVRQLRQQCRCSTCIDFAGQRRVKDQHVGHPRGLSARVPAPASRPA
jgi:hypothetical protein